MIAVTLAFKRLICRVLIGVLVSAQFAIAAYACPALSEAMTAHAAVAPIAAGAPAAAGNPHASMAAMKMDGDRHDAAIDPALPHLCMGHCQFGNQSADPTTTPVVSPVLLTALYALPAAKDAAASGVPRANSLRGGPPGADPPHSILHCCLRD